MECPKTHKINAAAFDVSDTLRVKQSLRGLSASDIEILGRHKNMCLEACDEQNTCIIPFIEVLKSTFGFLGRRELLTSIQQCMIDRDSLSELFDVTETSTIADNNGSCDLPSSPGDNIGTCPCPKKKKKKKKKCNIRIKNKR